MTELKKFRILGLAGKCLLFTPLIIVFFTIIMSANHTPVAVTKDGDLNGDGIISHADVSLILNISSDLAVAQTPERMKKADVDSDGIISANDAKLASQHMSSMVVFVDDTEKETTTLPLVENYFESENLPAENQNETPVVGGNDQYSVISNQKMYIYPDLTQVMQMRDTFVIVAFGWGHGVGMSQWGALGLARAGYSYIQIIQHYYQGVAIMKEQYPATVRCAGKNVNTVEMLARIVQQEISGITKKNDPLDMNALRAQALAAYTNMKYSNYSVSGCSYVNSYAACRDDVKAAAQEIAGQYMLYNGSIPYAYYSACSAGVTATYQDIWGNTNKDMSYLYNTASYYDCYTKGYISATAYSPQAIKDYILAYYPSVELSDDPAQWIKILRHDDAVNENIGYVSAMQIGNKTINQTAGITFRDKIMKYKVKSPCFAIIYNGQYL